MPVYKNSIIKKAILGSIFLVLLVFVLLALKKPQLHANWDITQMQLPEVELEGDVFRVNKIRDFSYFPDATIKQQRYIDQSFKFSELQNVWLGVSQFNHLGLAHIFLSFEFDNARSQKRYLVVSLEARRKQGQAYRPLFGLLRAYEKIVVFGTERDIIGLRSHIRKEDVYLYPLQLSASRKVGLLARFLNDAKHLQSKAAFYNSFFDNCLTAFVEETQLLWGAKKAFNWRLILTSYFDELAYQWGLLNTSLSFQTLKQQALIDKRLFSDSEHSFSQIIRSKYTP